MTQPLASEQLSAYLDGELDAAEVAELEAQLASDSGLREELDTLREAADFLRIHGPVQAPPTLYGGVMRAVEDEPMPGSWWRGLRRPFGLPVEGLAVAAAALVVLVFALDLGRDTFTGGLDAAPAAPVDKGQRPAGEDSLSLSSPEAEGANQQVADASPPSASSSVSKEALPKKALPKDVLPKGAMGVEDGGTGEAPEAPAQQASSGPKGTDVAPTGSKTTDTGLQVLAISAPYAAYALRTDDTYVMGKLERGVAKLGGSMTVKAGGAGEDGVEPGSRVQVEISVPAESLADFERYVHNLGLVEKRTGSPRDTITSTVVDIPLIIEVVGEAPRGPSPQSAP